MDQSIQGIFSTAEDIFFGFFWEMQEINVCERAQES